MLLQRKEIYSEVENYFNMFYRQEIKKSPSANRRGFIAFSKCLVRNLPKFIQQQLLLQQQLQPELQLLLLQVLQQQLFQQLQQLSFQRVLLLSLR